MTDLTKIAGRLIGDVRDLVDWGVEGGHIDEQQLRLTIEARRIMAKELVDGGISQRQAAKMLGVSVATIHNDVQELNEKCQKLNTVKPRPSGALRVKLNWLQNKWRCQRRNAV